MKKENYNLILYVQTILVYKIQPSFFELTKLQFFIQHAKFSFHIFNERFSQIKMKIIR